MRELVLLVAVIQINNRAFLSRRLPLRSVLYLLSGGTVRQNTKQDFPVIGIGGNETWIRFPSHDCEADCALSAFLA